MSALSIVRSAVSGALLLLVAGSASAQSASRPLAAEDYYRFRDVASPTISPDGRWVAFTLSRRIEETNTDSSEVWVVPADGSAQASRVSRPGEDASSPEWLGDGRLQYIEANRTWAADPGAPERIVASPRRVDGAVSPDGRWLAVAREVTASAAAPPALSEFERRHEERFAGKRFDWLNFQRDGGPFPVPDSRDPQANPAAEIVLMPVTGDAEERELTRLGLQPRELAWTPDGTTIVFTADTTFRDELRYGRADLWSVNLSGELRRLTRDDRFVHRSPAISPDGRHIAFVRSFATDYVIRERLDHGGPTDLWLVPVGGGEPVNLTADWDLQAGAPMWSPDGRYLYFPAATGGARHLFRVAAAGGAVEQVTSGERRLNGLTIDSAFRRIAYLVGRHDAPPDVHVANVDGTGERRLTQLHAPLLGSIALSSAERLHFESPDGTRIEGWLLLPHDYRPDGGPYPLIVNSHGGPHAASGYDFNFKHQLFAAAGYMVLETNFRSSTGYGEEFLWATWGEWGTKDGQDVVAGVDHVLANYPADPARVGTMGHSYGGFMSNWLITQYPERFAAAIVGAGISNWISDYGTADIARTKETEFYGYPWDEEPRERMIRQSPLTHAGRVRTPTLFVHGQNDQRVPYEEAEQMYTALKKLGVPAEMIIYDGQAHGIRGHWNVMHRAMNELRWWDRWLRRTTS
jgi:dipeptidyl aminopeptidase/acylaminoacyl peptidase